MAGEKKPPEGGNGGELGEPAGAAGKTDSPTTALTEFAGAATKWTPLTGDEKISAGFLLGWRIGLALDWAAMGEHVMWPDDDPELDDGDARWSVLRGQIEKSAKDLTSAAGDSITLPELGAASPEKDSTAVQEYRRALLQRLYVTDQFCGLAFTLGAQLEGMCAQTRRVGPEKTSVVDQLKADIPEIKKLLLGLATKLPPNASHSVMNSLTLWEEQLDRHGDHFDGQKLRMQGGVWRSVLSSDVAARDLLHLSDYIGTAQQVVARLHDFALRALRSQLIVPAVVAVVLLVGGFLVMVLSDKVAAGAAGVIAALGLSWKGIGQYFGRAAAQAEQALWNGQLDWTIAYRATISLCDPVKVGKREAILVRARRRHEDPSAQRRQGHFDTWQTWLLTWPDFELDL